jgi:ABC-type glycerol-3-phosphate transport system substrate-binding protein
MKKRIFSILSILLIVALVAACAPATETPMEEPTEEEPIAEETEEEPVEEEAETEDYSVEPTTLNILMETVPDTDFVEEYISEFEAATGHTVNIEKVSYLNMKEKLIPDLSSGEGNGAYDVIVLDKQWVGEFVSADWLWSLEDYIARDNFDTSVYVPAMFDMMGEVNGTTYMLPFYNYSSGLLYRTDIFENENYKAEYLAEFGEELKVPETVEEYVKVAKNLTKDNDGDGEIDMYGAIGQYYREIVQFEYSIILFGLGGWYYDDDWNATVNNETGVQAAEYVLDLYQNAMPEAATGYGFEEQSNFMAQGNAAMMLTYSWMKAVLDNPETSSVAGNVAFTISPGGHGAQGGWGWAIPRSSPNPEAAWQFLSWVESPEIAIKRGLLGAAPVRYDVFNDPDVLAKYPQNEVMLRVIEGAKPIPIIANSSLVPEYVNLYVSEMLAGEKTPQEAMDALAEKLNEIVVGDPLTGK